GAGEAGGSGARAWRRRRRRARSRRGRSRPAPAPAQRLPNPMSTPAGSVWRPVYRRSTGSKGGPAAVLHHSASAVKAIRSRIIDSGGYAEGVPAVDAAVLAVGLAALDEEHALSGHGADERMGHLG